MKGSRIAKFRQEPTALLKQLLDHGLTGCLRSLKTPSVGMGCELNHGASASRNRLGGGVQVF